MKPQIYEKLNSMFRLETEIYWNTESLINSWGGGGELSSYSLPISHKAIFYYNLQSLFERYAWQAKSNVVVTNL